jgi:predicted Rossmann fold flavoprotein
MSGKLEVLVIGGGPAGMMAAIAAARQGRKTALLDGNDRLGIKLLMTGHGRCNIANAKPPADLIAKIGPKARFLHSALRAFGVDELTAFFAERGLIFKEEAGNRLFPVTDRATDVLAILKKELDSLGVTIYFGTRAKDLLFAQGRVEGVILQDGRSFQADSYIVATGGLSYPATGSTGVGLAWAQASGHGLEPVRPGLTALDFRDYHEAKLLEGLSLTANGQVKDRSGYQLTSGRGSLIFTSTGVSGPLAHDLSLALPEKIRGLSLVLDLFSDTSETELAAALQTSFHTEGVKMLKNGLQRFFAPKILPLIIARSGFEPSKLQSSITKNERQTLVVLAKNLSFELSSTGGYDKANITVGGVSLSDVDPKSLRSKIIANLFFAGEVLDLVGPTGGYNLQIAWSTGFVAGSSAGLEKSRS